MKSIGLKISLLVACMIALIIFFGMYITSGQSADLVEELTGKETMAANRAFATELERRKNDARTLAAAIAAEHSVVDAVASGNEDAIRASLVQYTSYDISYVVVCDAAGTVIARMDDDRKGDDISNIPSVKAALETGTGVSTIERGAISGITAAGSAAVKIPGGTVIGAVICVHDLTRPEYVDIVKEYSNCEATLFVDDVRVNTTLIDEDGNRVIGTKASDAVVETVLRQRNDFTSRVVLFGSTYASHYSPLIVDDEVVGMLFTGVNIDETLAMQRSMLVMVMVPCISFGIVCILLCFCFSFFAVSKPLKKLDDFASRIELGELGISDASVAKIDVKSSDEIGRLARALEKAFEQLRGYIMEIRGRMQDLAHGDLTNESDYEFKGDFILIKESINEIVRDFNNTMAEVSASTLQVSSGAKHIADGAQILAQGSTEQSASIKVISASISDIADKTRENAEKAGKAAAMANAIMQNAEKGSRQMDEMMNAVREINEASHSISKVIKVIDDIAFQTNILALNAAVEAARAGQHGKGFAVVAEEVRNLAAKSAEAAKETGDMIQNSMEKAEFGAKIADETASSLVEIVSGINESTQIVTEIAESSESQSEGIDHLNTGIDQVAQVVQQNSATAQESAAAAVQMNGQSDILERLVSHFKI